MSNTRGIRSSATALLGLLGLVAAACVSGSGTAKNEGAVGTSSPEVPAGAIRAGDDFYMVPAGRDPTGCPWFRAFSQAKAVVQVMYYRAADGTFGIDRNKAANCLR